MKEIRRLKERIRAYADYTLDLVDILDDSKDLIEQVRKELERIVREGRDVTRINVPSGEIFTAKDILEFINSAPQDQIDMFREYLSKELARRRRLWGDVEKITREIERYEEELGVYVPFDIIEYDRWCYKRGDCLFFFKVEIGGSVYLDEYSGSLNDLIELFKEVVDREGKKISRLISYTRRERSKIMGELLGFKEFLEEIERHIYSDAILTIAGTKLSRPRSWRDLQDAVVELYNMGLEKIGDQEIIKWDAKKLKDCFVIYGANPRLWPDFYRWFKESLLQSKILTILLRSFRKEIDEITGLPIKTKIKKPDLRLKAG